MSTAGPMARPVELVRPGSFAGFDAAVSFGFAGLVVAACAAGGEEFQHWFVVPVLLCGGLAGIDAVGWIFGRRDLFDARGLIGAIGLHFFFAAPLLHVGTEYWMPYVEPPDDWRPWLGRMAWLNVAGLMIYHVCRSLLDRTRPALYRRVWIIDDARFGPVWAIALAFTAGLQLFVYARFGGIAGYVAAFTESTAKFAGWGIVFMFSEAFPILAVIAAARWAQRDARRRTVLFVVAVIVCFLALKLFFGGFRGSRGHVIYGIFWCLGILHLTVKPLNRRGLAVMGVGFGVFMYAYAFYKDFGSHALEALLNPSLRQELSDLTPRSSNSLLLGDLGRSDVQAFVLFRLSSESPPTRYELCRGQTYLGAISLLVPRSLIGERPPTKTKAGTDLLLGPGVYDHEMVATYAYGLGGEAMLNFGPLGAVLSFAALAVAVVLVRRVRDKLSPGDARMFLWPFVLSLAFMLLVWDSDVLVFYTIKEALLPTFLLSIVCRKVPATARVRGPR
jgi:hypothetical protein